jgi:hypothetical protein
MRRIFFGLAALSVLLTNGGCATIVRGTHQTVSVDTDPPGVKVLVDGRQYITPAEISLRRKVPHQAILEKDGYRTIVFNLSPEWDGVSLVGAIVIPGGTLGLVADRETGADMNFYTLAKIKMVPSTRPSEPPVVLTGYKGRLLTDDQYFQALAYDRSDRSQFFRGEP